MGARSSPEGYRVAVGRYGLPVRKRARRRRRLRIAGVLLVAASVAGCSHVTGRSRRSPASRRRAPSSPSSTTIANTVASADVHDPDDVQEDADTAVHDYVANVRELRAIAPDDLHAGLTRVEADVQQFRFDAARHRSGRARRVRGAHVRPGRRAPRRRPRAARPTTHDRRPSASTTVPDGRDRPRTCAVRRRARCTRRGRHDRTDSESRRALREFIALLQEIDERYLGDEWRANAFGDLPDGFRQIASMLEGGFHLMFELDPERPFFRRIVTRSRKMLGDNADAIYYTAPVRSDRAYRVTGNLAGAVYLSFTVERNTSEGGYSTETAGVLERRPDRLHRGRRLRGLLRRRTARDATGSSSSTARRSSSCAATSRSRRRPRPTSNRIVPLTIETARAGRSARAVGRRVGRGGLAARDARSCVRARSTNPSPANACSPHGCRRRRTSSRRPSCRARSRSRPPTPRTRWRRICSRRTRRSSSPAVGRSAGSRASRCGRATCRPTTTRTAPRACNRASTTLEPDGVVPHGARALRSRRSELDRHRGQGVRHGVLAVLPARGRGRDAAGDGVKLADVR